MAYGFARRELYDNVASECSMNLRIVQKSPQVYRTKNPSRRFAVNANVKYPIMEPRYLDIYEQTSSPNKSLGLYTTKFALLFIIYIDIV